MFQCWVCKNFSDDYDCKDDVYSSHDDSDDDNEGEDVRIPKENSSDTEDEFVDSINKKWHGIQY